jgi:hypothetical protein
MIRRPTFSHAESEISAKQAPKGSGNSNQSPTTMIAAVCPPTASQRRRISVERRSCRPDQRP